MICGHDEAALLFLIDGGEDVNWLASGRENQVTRERLIFLVALDDLTLIEGNENFFTRDSALQQALESVLSPEYAPVGGQAANEVAR